MLDPVLQHCTFFFELVVVVLELLDESSEIVNLLFVVEFDLFNWDSEVVRNIVHGPQSFIFSP